MWLVRYRTLSGAWILDRIKPKDAGLLLGMACLELGFVWCQWMTGPVNAYNTDLS